MQDSTPSNNITDDNYGLDYFCQLVDDTTEEEIRAAFKNLLQEKEFKKALTLRQNYSFLKGLEFNIPLSILHEFTRYLLQEEPELFNRHILCNSHFLSYFIGGELHYGLVAQRLSPEAINENFLLALKSNNRNIVLSIWTNKTIWDNNTTFSDYYTGLPVVVNKRNETGVSETTSYQITPEQLTSNCQQILDAQLIYIIEAMWPHAKNHFYQAVNTLDHVALAQLLKKCNACASSTSFFKEFVEVIDNLSGVNAALKEIKRGPLRKFLSQRQSLLIERESPSSLTKRTRKELEHTSQSTSSFFQSIAMSKNEPVLKKERRENKPC